MTVGLELFYFIFFNAKVDTTYIFYCAVVIAFLDENQNLDFIINI